MKAVKKALLGTVLVALCAPLLAAADLPDGKWWKRPLLAREIGLTEDQARDIEKIFVRSRPKLIDLRADLEKKQLALQVSMEDQAADRHVVEKQIEAVENSRAELQKARALMILDMKQVLKPAQWERLLQLQQRVRERRLMRQERFGDPGPNSRREPPPRGGKQDQEPR